MVTNDIPSTNYLFIDNNKLLNTGLINEHCSRQTLLGTNTDILILVTCNLMDDM